MMSSAQREKIGMMSISCPTILVNLLTKMCEFFTKTGTNFSKIWKWKAGVRILRCFFHISPEKNVVIRFVSNKHYRNGWNKYVPKNQNITNKLFGNQYFNWMQLLTGGLFKSEKTKNGLWYVQKMGSSKSRKVFFVNNFSRGKIIVKP